MTDNTYDQVGQALEFIASNWEEQPGLGDVADQVGMSEHHFQRLFSRWVGLSPKKFLSVLTLDQARRRLDNSVSVLDAAYDSGLSGPGRLHDLFVSYEAMTPGEYKAQGAGMVIRHGWHDSPFGRTLLMVTDRGLCGLAFLDERGEDGCFQDMADRWPQARFVEDLAETGALMQVIFRQPGEEPMGSGQPLRLFIKGTEFQVKVWEALMELPQASLTTYGDIAKRLNMPTGAARAVGTAVGMNPISWLIPCHRVIRNSGALGGYRWGLPRKLAMMGWEAAAAESLREEVA